jgi:hypothetical protein
MIKCASIDEFSNGNQKTSNSFTFNNVLYNIPAFNPFDPFVYISLPQKSFETPTLDAPFQLLEVDFTSTPSNQCSQIDNNFLITYDLHIKSNTTVLFTKSTSSYTRQCVNSITDGYTGNNLFMCYYNNNGNTPIKLCVVMNASVISPYSSQCTNFNYGTLCARINRVGSLSTFKEKSKIDMGNTTANVEFGAQQGNDVCWVVSTTVNNSGFDMRMNTPTTGNVYACYAICNRPVAESGEWELCSQGITNALIVCNSTSVTYTSYVYTTNKYPGCGNAQSQITVFSLGCNGFGWSRTGIINDSYIWLDLGI